MIRLFAYGSNMAEEEMVAFAPGASFLGIARLPDFRLEFRRRSIRRGGGAADIVEAPGDEVWGALYEVGGLEQLDAKEGAGFAYRRREVVVEAGSKTVPALAYEVIDKEPEEVPPTRAYAALLLAAAEGRGLPLAYVERLKRRLG